MTEDEQIRHGIKIFALVVGATASALAASTVRARKKAMQQRVNNLFQQGRPISVVHFLSDENGTHRITGTILKIDDLFQLKITRDEKELLHEAEFADQRGLEEYLENRTSMRLADFTRR